ncbi:caspase domain-containing protein [Streptomyces sp. NPDC057680]|uniref:caspase family protein n=1 Tax=Streptomyces sp. NPDC057680 TaxID=3346208 RepID=UPI003681C012
MSTSDTPRPSHIGGNVHPANITSASSFEHGADRAWQTDGAISFGAPAGEALPDRVLQDRLSERLRTLYQRAQAARQLFFMGSAVQDVVAAAHAMELPGSSELTEHLLGRWLSPRTFETPRSKDRQDAFIAAVTVMSNWAGAAPDLGDWCELVSGAAREAVNLRTARKQANRVGRRSESVQRMTRERIVFATPESLGVTRYREFCSAAGVDHDATGYGLLLLQGDDGRRVILLTPSITYASELARMEELSPGHLQSVDIPLNAFISQLEGWPDRRDVEFSFPFTESVPVWLVRMMREAGVSPDQLAENIGMARADVEAWINGQAKPYHSVERSARKYLARRRTLATHIRNSQEPNDFSVESIDSFTWERERAVSPQRFFPCWQHGAAVLVGVSDYQEMAPVKSIANNLESLEEIMVGSMGIPVENVFVVKNPESQSDVHDAVERAAEAADPSSGALLVYFAGHGWTDARGRLMLGLVHSSRARPWSAFDFNNLRIQIADSQIGKRVVILDSCYSGAALDVLGQPEELASAAVIDGTYVLTSANATTAALAPAGERFTTFTGHLVNALLQGIPQGPHIINTDVLFRYIERISKARGLPAPGRQIGGDGDRVEIMTNKWGK